MYITSEQIVRTAKEWLGTRFVHKGMIKKTGLSDLGGCDCIGLIIGIAADLGITLKDQHPYNIAKTYQNYKTINNTDLVGIMNQFLTCATMPKLGSIVVFAPNPRTPHVGIISKLDSNAWYFINANKQAGMVVEQITDQHLLQHISGIFCFQHQTTND